MADLDTTVMTEIDRILFFRCTHSHVFMTMARIITHNALSDFVTVSRTLFLVLDPFPIEDRRNIIARGFFLRQEVFAARHQS
jgi:hypothetical protein